MSDARAFDFYEKKPFLVSRQGAKNEAHLGEGEGHAPLSREMRTIYPIDITPTMLTAYRVKQ